MSDTNGHSLDSLREQTRLARARSRLAAAKAEAQLAESLTTQGFGFGLGWSDILDPFSFNNDAFQGMWLPRHAGSLYGRHDGRYHPFIWTDVDLDRQRSLARWLCTKNPIAQGAIGTLVNYTVKTGYGWEARPDKRYKDDPRVKQLAQQVQDVIDEVADVNLLGQRERSCCLRAVRDGEAITRTFDQGDGLTIFRFVEPEQMREPPGADTNCAFGVETQPHDIEDPVAYYVTYDGTEYDRLDAEDVCHLKRNVDECVKRGISDFFSVGELLDGLQKLVRNMNAGAAAQAAIAWIEQFKQTTATQASSHIAAIRDLRLPTFQHPISGRDMNRQHIEPGTVIKVDENREYIPAPLASNTTQHTSVVQAVMRFAGTRWHMPEYMVSGSAENANYSSTLVAGSPFVNHVECEQDVFGLHFLRWRWIAVRNACRAGRIRGYSFEQVQQLIDLHFTPPSVAVANEQEKAQIDHQDIAAGVMSLQTRRARRGLEDDQERANLKEEPVTRIQGKATDIDPSGNPKQPDGSPQANGGLGALAGMGLGEAIRTAIREAIQEALDPDSLPTLADLQEAEKRQKGEVWQGPSGRWFTINQAGRAVRAKNPNPQEKAKGKLAKPQKADPEAAKGKIREMLAAGKAAGKMAPDEIKEMAAHIMSLSVPHMDALKKELNLPASGPKAEKALKMMKRALAAVAAGKGEEKPKVKDAAVVPHEKVLSLFNDLEHADSGQAPIHEMFARSGMDAATFKKIMFDLRRQGKLRLIAVGDRSRFTPEQLRQSIEGENETFVTAERTDDTPAGKAEEKPVAPVPSVQEPAAEKAKAPPAKIDPGEALRKLQRMHAGALSRNLSDEQIESTVREIQAGLSATQFADMAQKFGIHKKGSKQQLADAIIDRIARQAGVYNRGLEGSGEETEKKARAPERERKTPKAKAPPADPMAGHPMAGMTREQQLAHLNQHSYATTRDPNPHKYDFKNYPAGVDGNAVSGRVADIVKNAKAKNSFMRPSIGDVYDQVKAAHPGLTMHQFHGVLAKMHGDKKIRLDPFTQALNTIERPEAVMPFDREKKNYIDLA